MNSWNTPLQSSSLAALKSATVLLANKPHTLIQAELIDTERKVRPHLDLLLKRYIATAKLGFEDEDEIFTAVVNLLGQLTAAYASTLRQPAPKIGFVLSGKVMQQQLDMIALTAKWYYLRYQPVNSPLWGMLHLAYSQAETIYSSDRLVGEKPNFEARYMRTLMLDIVNRSNMQKAEIELTDQWLSLWCQNLSLDKTYDESRHQFYVDLEIEQGARPIRDLQVKSSQRYWNADPIMAVLTEMKQQLQQQVLPVLFPEHTPIAGAERHIDLLLAAWTFQQYKRQRRAEERAPVHKIAHVVHGVLNVCQHVKNLMFANNFSPSSHDHSIDDGWIIENESKFGFGALVNAESNPWLKPGCLIALDSQLNPEMTTLGVVRNIQQQAFDCYVGIEVLSHTPTYVRLQPLQERALVLPDAKFFPAMYLGKDDDRGTPASLVIPIFDFIADATYELRTQQSAHHVQVGDILEQQDDWIRVTATLVPKQSALAKRPA